MKENLLNVAHKTVTGILFGLTLVGVYHTSMGTYGIISRRIAYTNSLEAAKVADSSEKKWNTIFLRQRGKCNSRSGGSPIVTKILNLDGRYFNAVPSRFNQHATLLINKSALCRKQLLEEGVLFWTWFNINKRTFESSYYYFLILRVRERIETTASSKC